jgi:hypothetical protein
MGHLDVGRPPGSIVAGINRGQTGLTPLFTGNMGTSRLSPDSPRFVVPRFVPCWRLWWFPQYKIKSKIKSNVGINRGQTGLTPLFAGKMGTSRLSPDSSSQGMVVGVGVFVALEALFHPWGFTRRLSAALPRLCWRRVRDPVDSKSRPRSTARSKATDRSVRPTRALWKFLSRPFVLPTGAGSFDCA